jgi:hypothetical protein
MAGEDECNVDEEGDTCAEGEVPVIEHIVSGDMGYVS